MGGRGARLVLASQSPRRRALLGELGLAFCVVVSNADESLVPGLDPTAQAVRLAERKARAVAGTLVDGLVLGADTIVVLAGDILGKPADAVEAAQMLHRLQGRWHAVVTGIALIDAANGVTRQGVVTSRVRMWPLVAADIDTYVATGEPLDKAGAYAIQGLGGGLVAGFTGCFTNIVGLPLCETASLLATFGVVPASAPPFCRLPDGAPCPRAV